MLLPAPESPAPARPWGTYALLALCVLVFVPVHFAHKNNIRQGIRLLEEAAGYYRAHPYLELDQRLEQVLWRGAGEDAGTAAVEWKKRLGQGKAKGSDFVALEQVELDGLTGAGIDALARLPHWRWGVVPGDLSARSLVGHLFLHAAWLPLLGNLVFLWFAGSYLESRWPPPFVIGCYLLSGVIAAGVFILKYPEFPVPFAGASGAVAGLVGVFAVLWGDRKLPVRYWLGPDRTDVVLVPALVLVGLWGLRESLAVLSPEVLVPDGGVAGVVYWDHLAGFGCGLILGAAVRFGGLERRLGGAVEVAVKPPVDAGAKAVAQARAVWDAGRAGEAWELLRGAARNDSGNREAVALLWELSGEDGRQAEAAPEMIRLVYHLSRSGAADEGFTLWTELRETVPECQMPAATEVRLGHALIGKDMGAEAQQVLATAASRVGPRELPMTLVMLAKGLQGPEKTRVARMALDHPDLPAAERVAMEALVPAPGAAPTPAGSGSEGAAPIPVARPQEKSPLRVIYAVPLGIKEGRLGIEVEGGGRRVLPLQKIRGIAGAAVYDGGVEPDYLLDLVLEFPRGKDAPASVIRFHCERFDPRKLVPTEPEVGDAMLSLGGQILTGGGGIWLLGAHPTELRAYDSPAAHQKELLSILRLNAGSG